MTTHENQRGDGMPLARVLYDIAHTLESVEDSEQRVRRVLDLLRDIVPYAHCALLHVRGTPRLVVSAASAERPAPELEQRLMKLFGLFVEEQRREVDAHPPSPGRLAVPLVGLDEVVGVLEIADGVDGYSVQDLRTLSVVAAQLAAHLTMVRARAEQADRARALDEARRAAEAANRAKDEFLALVSLTLKTPLNSTLAWAQRLASEDLDAAARAHAVEGIERGVRAQSKLIDDILDLADIATAAVRLDLRATEPALAIRRTLEGLRLQAEERAIRLESELDPEVSSVVVDPDRFDQIVSKLVANALHVTPKGGRVEVRLERADHRARLRVTDGGSGIAPELLPHAFESFHVQRRASGSLGIDLAIVKSLVELHGGSVRAESAGVHAGATLTVELPLASEQPLDGLRVLLVDDDEDFRDALVVLLEARGALVTAVDSVAAALAALEGSRPDVLLSELAMPRESGYDLIREVAARDATLPVAALTKHGTLAESKRAAAAGFRMHLVKPIDVDALVTAVATLAGRPRGAAHRVTRAI